MFYEGKFDLPVTILVITMCGALFAASVLLNSHMKAQAYSPSKAESSTQESIEAVIIGERLTESKRVALPTGNNIIIPQTKTSYIYEIQVRAGDKVYTISDNYTYELYSELVGEKVSCTITTYTYPDGKQIPRLTSIDRVID